MKSQPIGVLIADDHTLVRRGLVSLLSLVDGIEVVGEASDGRLAVDLALKLDPDVVLMDVSMPGLNGLEATRQLKKESPQIKVLVLSAHDNEEYVLQVMRSGANGYILKNSSAEELYAAIRAVYTGQAFFSPSVSRILLDSFKEARSHPGSDASSSRQLPESRLTSREREVLQLIAEGKTHQEAASLLHISARTVDTHCNNIMKKLDIHESAGLAAYAIKNGILILPR
jgi:two-component system nitrate/nitrite response regulator NarL